MGGVFPTRMRVVLVAKKLTGKREITGDRAARRARRLHHCFDCTPPPTSQSHPIHNASLTNRRKTEQTHNTSSQHLISKFHAHTHTRTHRKLRTMGQLVRSLAVGRSVQELFKSLQKVSVTMNPFDRHATTARYVVTKKQAFTPTLPKKRVHIAQVF